VTNIVGGGNWVNWTGQWASTLTDHNPNPPITLEDKCKFPRIVAKVTGNDTVGTPYDVTLPSGIQSGELLLVVMNIQGSGNSVSFPAGWTEIYTEFVSTTIDMTHTAWYRFADGTETSPLAVTCAFGGRAIWRSERVADVDTSFAPQFAKATGTDANPNSPSLSPTWGARKVLWRSVSANNDAADTVSAYPTNYQQDQENLLGATGSALAFSGRWLETGTEDPGAYTLAGAEDWSAATIAICGVCADDFMSASVSPDEADTTDFADYGSNIDPQDAPAAAPEDFILGIEDGSAGVAIDAHYDAGFQDAYEGSISNVVVDDVVAAEEPVYSDTDTLQDGRDLDWTDWYWSQGPPIDDNDQEFLPASVSPDEADTTDFADYGFSAGPLSDDNNPEVAPSALDDQDFTDAADYGATVDPAIPDNDQEFLPASVSPDEADTTDTADYGTQSDQLSDDLREDFALGIAVDEYDATDFVEYGSQQDGLQDAAACVFPAVSATATGFGPDDTSVAVTIPGTFAAGDLLLIHHAVEDGAAVATPAGWVKRYAGTNLPSSVFFYRWADGSEGGTVTVTSTGTTAYAYWSARVVGADPAKNPEAGTVVEVTTANPNPPSLTPSWGSEKTLWLVALAAQGTRTVSAYPANYTGNQSEVTSGTTATDARSAIATRELQAASEDPGTFTMSASGGTSVNTVAIKGICNVTPEDFVLGVSEHDHDWTDHADYGLAVDQLSDDLAAPQDFVLGVSEPEQDYTDFAEYGSVVDQTIDDASTAPELRYLRATLEEQSRKHRYRQKYRTFGRSE
jgi:hypothetical protein